MVVIWAEGQVLSRLELVRLAQARHSKAWLAFGDLVEPGCMTLCVLGLVSELVKEDEKALAMEMLSSAQHLLRGMDREGELRDCLDRAGDLEPDELATLRREVASAWLPKVERFYPLEHPEPDSCQDGKDFDGSSLTSDRDGQ